MRFFHADFEPVRNHLQRERCVIAMLEWEREPIEGGLAFLGFMQKRRAAHAPKIVGIAEVAHFADRGSDPAHAGTVLRHYFHVNSSVVGRPLSLVEAVEHVEAVGRADEFVLAGHPDGGLISVSRHALAFQHGVSPVEWWGP